MEKVLLKCSIFIITLILLLNFFTAICYADDNFDFNPYGNNATTTGDVDPDPIINPIKKVAGVVISAIKIIGTGIALIMIAVISIKYMVAAPGDRADIKKSSIQYVVGAIILFGASQILGILIKFFSGLVS